MDTVLSKHMRACRNATLKMEKRGSRRPLHVRPPDVEEADVEAGKRLECSRREIKRTRRVARLVEWSVGGSSSEEGKSRRTGQASATMASIDLPVETRVMRTVLPQWGPGYPSPNMRVSIATR